MKRPGYDDAERRRIAEDIRAGGEPTCPSCGGSLSVTAVAVAPSVPYVRRRLLVVCASCRRRASIDAPAG